MSIESFNIIASQRTAFGVDGSITPLASKFAPVAENTAENGIALDPKFEL